MMKHSANFQVTSIKDVAGVAGNRYKSARAVTSSKIAEIKSETTCTSSYDKKAIYKISYQSDERRERELRGQDRTDGMTNGMTDGRTHDRKRVISIAPSAYVGLQ